ncbi:MAG: hypothetical protein Udaeo_07340 [Candidatus Udaeobacter sp.]|nr:MAG: hypothetical protein Udaeo_07340 [Candidatus Udaeobacter sp.]
MIGRDPAEFPAHPFAHGFDFFNRRAGHGDVRNFVVLEMRQDAVDVIDFKRAADALRLLPRPEHEVFDEKLAAPVKQLGQRDLAFRRVENVLLVDLYPRQRATFRGQLIA